MPVMIWVGALQKTGNLTKLEPFKGDVRAVTVYTHTFVMAGKNGLADDREDPFFTASGETPQEAEALARTVYLKAIACTHRMARRAPMLMECEVCGVQQRTALAKTAAVEATPAAKQPARKKTAKTGWLGWLRSA